MALPVKVEVLGDAASYTATLGLATAATEKFATAYQAEFASMSTSTLALATAQDKLAISTARYGSGTTGAARATLTYRKEVDALRASQLAAAREIGGTMTRYVTAPTLLAAFASVKLGASFEDTLQRMVGLSGVAQGSVDSLGKEILDLAPKVGKSPQELAEALYFITSSGIDAAHAMDVLTVSAQASAAGLGDTQVVADAVTSVINAYGAANITAAEATDTLVATVREGKGEAAAFAGVIGNIAALSSQLGVSFNDVGAALAAETRLGVDAETAAIQLNQIFSTLIKTSPAAEKGFKAVGLSSAGLRRELREQGLLAVLETLRTSFDGNASAAAHAFRDVRALRGVLALVGAQGDATVGVFNRMNDTTGATSLAFKATDDDLRRYRQTMATIQVALIKFGAAISPIATGAAAAVATIADAFDRLPGPVKQDLGIILALLAVGGPLMLAGVGVTKMVGSIARAFELLPVKAGPAIAATEAEVATLGATTATTAARVSRLQGSLLLLARAAPYVIALQIVLENKDSIDAWFESHHLGFLNNGLLETIGVTGGGGDSSGTGPTNPDGTHLRIDPTTGQVVPYQLGTAGTSSTSSSTGLPMASGAAQLATPLSEQQKLANALISHPDSIPLLEQKAQHDRASLAFAEKLRIEGRISNAKYQQFYAAYMGDLVSTEEHIAALVQGAKDKIKAAAEKRRSALLETIGEGAHGSALIPGAFGAYRKKVIDSIPTHISGSSKFTGAFPFDVPMELQIAAARAATTSVTSDDIKVAKETKAFAERIIASGRLRGQALIDAYNSIAQQNGIIGQQVSGTAYKAASSVKLTAGLGLTGDERRRLEARYSQALVHGGRVPTGPAALGIALGADGRPPAPVHVHVTIDGREVGRVVIDDLQKRQRAGAPTQRGSHGGHYLGIN